MSSHSSLSLPTTAELSNAPTPKAGRPPGSKDEKRRNDILNYNACVDAIASSYYAERLLQKSLNKRCKSGFLLNLTEEKKATFKVTVDISKASIRRRVQRGSPLGNNVQSPLTLPKMVWVKLYIQMGEI